MNMHMATNYLISAWTQGTRLRLSGLRRLLAISLAALLPVTASFAQTVSFDPATNFAVGTTPLSVAIGDLNGDGKPDLAVANYASGNVSILLGDGTGAFGAATNVTAGTGAHSVAIGDLDGDGKPDLAVANYLNNNVSILLGDGTGAFGATTNFTAGFRPVSVAIGDLNGDGTPDLAVANHSSSNVSILLGDGTGDFGAATNVVVGTTPVSVAIGDLNGDGAPDLAVANLNSHNVSILLGDGTGAFGAATNVTAGVNPRWVAIGDLNGDGQPDLAVANISGNNVSILLGDGTGAFGAATNFAGARPTSVVIGDFNGDGKPDLAMENGHSNNVSILLGDGTGAFGAATNFAVGSDPVSVAVGDLNGDGKPDLAVANVSSNNVSILLNTTQFAPSDTTAPVVTGMLTPAPNGAGWNNTDVAIAWSASDPESAITSGPTPASATASVDGAGQIFSATATNGAGLVGDGSVTVNVDKTKPAIIAGIIAGTEGSSGWYTSNVTVRFVCSDATSGVANCPGDQTLTGQGVNISSAQSATDFAGNTSDASNAVAVNIDSVSPTLSITGVNDGGVYTLGPVNPGIQCSDATSGVESSSGNLTGGNANGVGIFTYSAACTDNAGNLSRQSATFSVLYSFSFLQPIPLPVSTFKGGSTIPVKFKVTDGAGVNITTAVATVSVNGGPSLGTATFDGEQYHFNLRTKGLPLGPLTIGVSLDDGTVRSVSVTLK